MRGGMGALVLLAVVGCATAGREFSAGSPGPPPPPPVTGPAAGVSAIEGRPGQWLFRAEISGDGGSGSLRLLLRRFAVDRFTLAAADALGQARWEIRRAGENAFWIDPATRRFCRLDPHRPLQSMLALPSIPLADFPALLTGEWPAESAVAESAAAGATADRPFTAEDDGPGISHGGGGGVRGVRRWASWTLWEVGVPVAWFKRLGQDSLLSVRRPAVQVRWRVTAESALEPAAEAGPEASAWPGDSPEGWSESVCPENEIP